MYCIVVPHYQKCTEKDIRQLGEIQKLYHDIDLFIVTFYNCDLSGISEDFNIYVAKDLMSFIDVDKINFSLCIDDEDDNQKVSVQ